MYVIVINGRINDSCEHASFYQKLFNEIIQSVQSKVLAGTMFLVVASGFYKKAERSITL